MFKNKLQVQFVEDLRNYTAIKYRDKEYTPSSLWQQLATLMTSRGLWNICFHRAQISVRNVYLDNRRLKATFIKLFFSIVEFLMQIVTKSHLHYKMTLGLKVYLSNKGNIILGARKLGSGSVLQENLTIGQNIVTKGENDLPTIGRNVWIGANSVIYGKIDIGDGVTICENTVLSRSIPANCVVKGNPAKVLIRNFDNSVLRSSPTLNSSTCIIDKIMK